jgi:hypothetical protein
MQPEEIWAHYQAGIDFKNGIDLYETVARNERFFAGDQWVGVAAPDLPKPVVNFIKRVCQQRIAEVKASPVKISFCAIDFPKSAVKGETIETATDSDTQLLNAIFEADWDRLKMDYVNLDGLQDACISGDYILYNYWDDSAPTGQTLRGRISVETIDNVNYYPGNPNERDVQKQPFIIIARREIVTDVCAQAKANGLGGAEISLITADCDTFYQSGDMAQNEQTGTEKCITLLCLWRDAQTGHIFAQKTARNAAVRKAWDTRLTRYPVAIMNWELRKNCCHGRAEITGLVPVQRYVNQMYAMTMLFTMQSACPKPLFNQGMIKAWSTAVGAAIPVNGDINNAAKYLEPPTIPGDAYSLPEKLMSKTLELLGVTDIELGNVNPTNMSAMTLARQASTLPVETICTRFYGMLEDFAANWLDMTLAFQAVPRWHSVSSGKKAVVLDAAALRSRLWSVRTEVGPAELWSEINSVQTLNALYKSGAIDTRQYIERLPDGYLPRRQQLLAELGSIAKT